MSRRIAPSIIASKPASGRSSSLLNRRDGPSHAKVRSMVYSQMTSSA
jgi:hypothetical protein